MGNEDTTTTKKTVIKRKPKIAIKRPISIQKPQVEQPHHGDNKLIRPLYGVSEKVWDLKEMLPMTETEFVLVLGDKGALRDVWEFAEAHKNYGDAASEGRLYIPDVRTKINIHLLERLEPNYKKLILMHTPHNLQSLIDNMKAAQIYGNWHNENAVNLGFDSYPFVHENSLYLDRRKIARAVKKEEDYSEEELEDRIDEVVEERKTEILEHLQKSVQPITVILYTPNNDERSNISEYEDRIMEIENLAGKALKEVLGKREPKFLRFCSPDYPADESRFEVFDDTKRVMSRIDEEKEIDPLLSVGRDIADSLKQLNFNAGEISKYLKGGYSEKMADLQKRLSTVRRSVR